MARGARGPPLPPPTRAGQGSAETTEHPSPRPAPGPTGPTRHLGNHGAGQSAASYGLPGQALVIIRRGREFKGLGARTRLRGVTRAGAGLCQRSSRMLIRSPCTTSSPSLFLPHFPSSSRMWGAEEVAGNTCFAYSGRSIDVID